MPSFVVGKRSADNARRFMLDVASRLLFPKPHEADDHAYEKSSYRIIVQVSTDGFAAYPEASRRIDSSRSSPRSSSP